MFKAEIIYKLLANDNFGESSLYPA
jgi:hypothetical protein